MRRALALALVLATASTAAQAEPRRVRYGKRIATYDAVAALAIGLGVYLVAHDPPREGYDGGQALGALLVVGGGATYLIAGPVIHARRDNSSGAWTSIAARALVPAAGALIGYQLDQERQVCDGVGYCGPDVIWPTLTIVGTAGAMVVDWFVLAKVERKNPGYVPYATTNRDGDVTFGIAGGF